MIPDLGELERGELLVLVAALRVMLMQDGVISDEESEALSRFARSLGLGEREWERLWSAANRALPSTPAVHEALTEIERERAREIVYEVLYRLAEADGIDDREWDLLEWLDESWQGLR